MTFNSAMRDQQSHFNTKVDSGSSNFNSQFTSAGAAISTIDKISVNGVDQPIVNKRVNITVPTKVSELENDKPYLEEQYFVNNLVTQASFSDGTFSFKNKDGIEKYSVDLPIYKGEVI